MIFQKMDDCPTLPRALLTCGMCPTGKGLMFTLMISQEIVALSGAHTLGRCHMVRSGFDGPWTSNPLAFTNEYFTNLVKKKWKIRQWDLLGSHTAEVRWRITRITYGGHSICAGRTHSPLQDSMVRTQSPCKIPQTRSPKYIPDWKTWLAQNPFALRRAGVGNEAAAEVATVAEQDTEFDEAYDTTITGPWMNMWELTHHNRHVEQHVKEQKT